MPGNVLVEVFGDGPKGLRGNVPEGSCGESLYPRGAQGLHELQLRVYALGNFRPVAAKEIAGIDLEEFG